MPDLLIPIVFPDYKITIETPAVRIKIPDYLPYVDILPDVVRVPHTKHKISNLGHAGVLFINGQSGVTKYYEYGRYDSKKLGWVKKIFNLPDVKIDSNGNVVKNTLSAVLQIISMKAGKGGRISAAYIKVQNKYEAILAYVRIRMAMNRNPNRERYDNTSYSCVHFMKGAMDAAGIDTPWMLDPRPTSYIKEIQNDYPSLEYMPSSDKVTIKELDSVVGF